MRIKLAVALVLVTLNGSMAQAQLADAFKDLNISEGLNDVMNDAIANQDNKGNKSSSTQSFDPSVLIYKTDPKVSQEIQKMILATASQKSPKAANQFKQIFANKTLKRFGESLKNQGIDINNVADVFALYVFTKWSIIYSNPEPTKEQMQGLQKSFARNLAATLKQTDNTKKQQLSEFLSYQIILNLASYAQASKAKDTAQINTIKQNARKSLMDVGIDPQKMELTNKGLVKKKTP